MSVVVSAGKITFPMLLLILLKSTTDKEVIPVRSTVAPGSMKSFPGFNHVGTLVSDPTKDTLDTEVKELEAAETDVRDGLSVTEEAFGGTMIFAMALETEVRSAEAPSPVIWLKSRVAPLDSFVPSCAQAGMVGSLPIGFMEVSPDVPIIVVNLELAARDRIELGSVTVFVTESGSAIDVYFELKVLREMFSPTPLTDDKSNVAPCAANVPSRAQAGKTDPLPVSVIVESPTSDVISFTEVPTVRFFIPEGSVAESIMEGNIIEEKAASSPARSKWPLRPCIELRSRQMSPDPKASAPARSHVGRVFDDPTTLTFLSPEDFPKSRSLSLAVK